MYADYALISRKANNRQTGQDPLTLFILTVFLAIHFFINPCDVLFRIVMAFNRPFARRCLFFKHLSAQPLTPLFNSRNFVTMRQREIKTKMP